jgi:hypothetical protein
MAITRYGVECGCLEKMLDSADLFVLPTIAGENPINGDALVTPLE